MALKKYYPKLYNEAHAMIVYIARYRVTIVREGRADQGLTFEPNLNALEEALNTFINDIALEEGI